MMKRTTMVKAVLVATALTSGAAVIGSGCKKERDAEYPLVQADAGDPWADATPQPTPQDATVAQDAATTPEAAPEATFDDITKAQLAEAIETRAKEEAKWMKPVGEVFGGVAQEGGTVESPVFQIDIGKCYTVIAEGGLGVQELDIQLEGAQVVPGMAPQLAVDNTTGPQAAITPCWKNGFPVGFPATVTLVVRQGSGPVAARVYAK